MTTTQPSVPNHHAHYPGFAGPAGFLAAASMVLSGAGNARLAGRLSELAAGDAVADIGCGPVPPPAVQPGPALGPLGSIPRR